MNDQLMNTGNRSATRGGGSATLPGAARCGRLHAGVLGALLAGTFAACSESGGGGAPPPVGTEELRLQGQLSVPDFATSLSAGGRFGDGGHYDGDGYHARKAPLDVHGARPVRIGGEVGPATVDALDVVQLQLRPGRYEVSLFAVPHAVELRVFEPATGAEIGAVTVDETLVLQVDAATAIDLAVRATAASARAVWRASVRAAGDEQDPAVRVPGLDPAQRPQSVLQAMYLGANAPMVPGQIVAVRDQAAARAASAIAPVPVEPLPGVRLQSRSPDDALLVYRIDAPATASALSGAPLAGSLEVQTCLTALRMGREGGFAAAAPDYLRRIDSAPAEVSGKAPVAASANSAPVPLRPSDEFFSLQWHFRVMDMEQAWDRTVGSSDVVVGVIDSGIVSGHPDFAGRIVDGFDFVSDRNRSLDGDGIDPNPEDPGDRALGPQGDSWHGTHVAGTIAANGDDGIGVAGMDWNCQLVPIRALGFQGQGTSSDILNAVRFAAGLANPAGRGPNVPRGRVDVLNMSLGSQGGSTVEEQVYAQVAAAGVLVVAAAGNDNSPVPMFPAAYGSTVSVGALGFDLRRAPYSNFASSIDVWAPGGDMSRDLSGDGFGDGVLSAVGPPSLAGNWDFSQGTSMAAPHVAGLASLLLGVAPGSSPNQLRALLTANTRPVDGGQRAFIQPVQALDAALGAGGGGGGVTGPDLVIDPFGVDLGPTGTRATLALRNAGTGRLDLATILDATFEPQVAQPWIGGQLVPTADPAISHDALEISVDRTGLTPGRYRVTLQLGDVGGTVTETVTVSMTVPDPTGAGGEEVFVVLVDPVLSDPTAQPRTVAQAVTGLADDYRFGFAFNSPNRPAPGLYLLAAGTDRDGDGFIGDEGELFGIFPLTDEPVFVEVPAGTATLDGLDFDLFELRQLGLRSGGRVFSRLGIERD